MRGKRHSSHPDVLEQWPMKLPQGHVPTLGPRFDQGEEAAIKRACVSAREFMRGYGAGRQPRMLDLRHYYMNTAVINPADTNEK